MFERNQRWPIGREGQEGQKGQKGQGVPSEPPATQWPLGWRIPSGGEMGEIEELTPPRPPESPESREPKR